MHVSTESSSSSCTPDLHYREIFDKIDSGFCVVQVLFDGEGRVADYVFLQVNLAFERETGMRDVVGRRVRELSPTQEEHWFRMFGDVALSGRSAKFENYAAALGRWWAVDAFRVGAPEQRLVAMQFLDITERKRVERDLAESEARFSALAEGLPMPVWVLDATGQLRFTNSAYADFFGIGAQADGTRPGWGEVLHPEDAGAFAFELRGALDEQRNLRALVRARRHDGEWRWIELTAVPRYAAEGEFIGLPAAARTSPSAATSSWPASSCSNRSAARAVPPKAWRG